jgi:hypothetical protein
MGFTVSAALAAELAAKVKAAVKVILNHQSPRASTAAQPRPRCYCLATPFFGLLSLPSTIASAAPLRKMINDPDWDEVAGAKPGR